MADDDQIQTENREANDLPVDAAEPVGNIEAVESRAAPKEEPKDDKPAEKKVSKYQDKRADIYAKAKAKRDKADEETDIEGLSDERERMVWGDKVETRADREARRREERGEVEKAPQEAVDRPVEAPESRMRLNVHGKEVELPQDEVIRLAQQAAAAGNILENAKQARAEQLQILEELRQAKANQSPAEQKASESAQTGSGENQPDVDELDEIIDRIQVGSPEDAKAALAKYGDMIVERAAERYGYSDQRVEETIRLHEENTRRQREMTETLSSFYKDHPSFEKSGSLQMALATEASEAMREKMHAIGVSDETIEQIKRSRGISNDIAAVAWSYRYLKGQGHDLPDNEAILRTSAERLRRSMGAPETARRQEEPRVSEERLERKRNLGPQPRRANAAPTAEVKERSREEARRSAVRQMKAYRRGRA